MFTISFVNFDHTLRFGQANDLKEAHVGKSPIFTNHVDKVRIMKKEVMPKRVAR
jgi:hypothetical protein